MRPADHAGDGLRLRKSALPDWTRRGDMLKDDIAAIKGVLPSVMTVLCFDEDGSAIDCPITPDRIARIVAHVERLEARVNTLSTALELFGQHSTKEDGCPVCAALRGKE
jgi:hypothetical protein